MPTDKRRVNITVNDELWDKLIKHRNDINALSVTTAAIDLIMKGLRQDGIIVETGYDALRERVDEDIKKAVQQKNI